MRRAYGRQAPVWSIGSLARNTILAAAFVATFFAAGDCSAALASKPGEFEVSRPRVPFGTHTLRATYVEQDKPRHLGYYIVFVTGDGGWRGTSAAVVEHLAAEGYSVAGFSAPEVLRPVKRSGKRANVGPTAQRLAELFMQAKRDLGVSREAAMIVVGFSRGATMVAFAAINPTLSHELAGAVAMGLTRESDYLRAPPPASRPPEIQVDKRDRIQIYPALNLIGSTPLAVIQSTRDRYVPAAESRNLLGPDTPTRRLYEVEARNHRFSGGREALLRDLDDALTWIERSPHATPHS